MTIDEFIDRLRWSRPDEPGCVLFLDAPSPPVYCEALMRLKSCTGSALIRVSGLLRENGRLDAADVLSRMRSSRGVGIVVGASQALALQGAGALFRFIDATDALVTAAGPCVVLTYQCKSSLERFLKSGVHPKWHERLFVLDGAAAGVISLDVVRLPDGDAPAGFFESLPEALAWFEDNGAGEPKRAVSRIPIEASATPPFNFRYVDSPFESLRLVAPDFPNGFTAEMGTEDQWRALFLAVCRAKSFAKAMGGLLDPSKAEEALARWSDLSEEQKWRLFLALKSKGEQTGYRQQVLRKSKTVTEFVHNAFNAIFDLEPGTERFHDSKSERKRLISFLNDETEANLFLQAVRARGVAALPYLSGLSDDENALAVELIGGVGSLDGLEAAIKEAFPTLSDYLGDFTFDGKDGAFFTDYFRTYRRLKVENRITPEFLSIVKDEAEDRRYNAVPSRDKVFGEMFDPATVKKVFFVDAMGVEYLPFVFACAERLKIMCEARVGRATLPSITTLNKGFLSKVPADRLLETKELDDLKHDGVQFNFETSKFPVHLVRELAILGSILSKCRNALLEGAESVMVVSDHGASRLVVLSKEDRITYGKENDGRHGGRCRKLSDAENDDVPTCATAENGYAVMAGYDRFKGGKIGQVENHGGATLEEVLVPILKFTRKSPYDVKILNESISIRKGKPARVLITVVPAVSELTARLDGREFPGASVPGNPNRFEVDLTGFTNSGTFQLSILSNHNVLATVPFEVSVGGMSEIDLF